jgi:hypothetical protein
MKKIEIDLKSFFTGIAYPGVVFLIFGRNPQGNETQQKDMRGKYQLQATMSPDGSQYFYLLDTETGDVYPREEYPGFYWQQDLPVLKFRSR